MKPHRCIVLAIDAAETSGYAEFTDGVLGYYGMCRAFDSTDVRRVVQRSMDTAAASKRTVILVGEDWAPYMQKNLAPYWRQWRHALDQSWAQVRSHGTTEPAPKSLRVNVSTWRSKVYGHRVGKAQAKEMAVMHANQRFGLELALEKHDIAEAMLIGFWATLAPEVLAKIPKRFR